MSQQTSKKIYNVLFLCTGNSARSIMAEAILNRDGTGHFQAFSAGSHPKGAIDPRALNLLKKLNHPTDSLRCKSWDEFVQPASPAMHFIFTVCDDAAQEVCPQWPGTPLTAHWGIPDPAVAEGSDAERALVMADAYRMLSNRIGVFVNLPLRALDRLALQRRLSAIGRPAGTARPDRQPPAVSLS